MNISAKGQTGTLIFDGNSVTIQRKGFLAASTQGRSEKRIPLQAISAVQFKPAGRVTQGFIGFTISGGTETKSKFGKQNRDAFLDENSVVFLYKSNADMQSLKDAIEAAMNAPTAPSVSGGVDQLEKLAQLHAQGVLSDEEFTAAKAKALGI